MSSISGCGIRLGSNFTPSYRFGGRVQSITQDAVAIEPIEPCLRRMHDHSVWVISGKAFEGLHLQVADSLQIVACFDAVEATRNLPCSMRSPVIDNDRR